MKTTAVVGMLLNSTQVVVYQTGLTPAGGPILRQKSLSDVRSDAAEQAVNVLLQEKKPSVKEGF